MSPQKYRHKQKHITKMPYSESEPDSTFVIILASNFDAIFSESISESDEWESDFSSLFMNLDIFIFFTLYLHSSK